jgi:hypothetical protein
VGGDQPAVRTGQGDGVRHPMIVRNAGPRAPAGAGFCERPRAIRTGEGPPP